MPRNRISLVTRSTKSGGNNTGKSMPMDMVMLLEAMDLPTFTAPIDRLGSYEHKLEPV